MIFVNSFSSSSFIVSLGYTMQTVMSSVNRDGFIFSFYICMCFISFSCLTALNRTASTMLNESPEQTSMPGSRSYRKNIQSFIINCDVKWSFCNILYQMKDAPLSYFSERFYHKWVWNFIKYFFYISWYGHVIFLL